MNGLFNFPWMRMLLAGLAAALLSLALTPPLKALLVRFGIVDAPSARRINKTPVPRGGGLAIVISCALALVFAVKSLNIRDPLWFSPGAPRLFLAFAIIFVTGFIDDLRGLNPFVKLAGQIAAAAVVFSAGYSVGHLVLFAVPDWLDFFVTVAWFVIIVNAFNLIDGLDGLATGLAVIGAMGLCTCLVLRGMGGKTLPLFILIGASLGFLRYNFNPASVFLGDTGSLFLGFSMALIPLATGGKAVFVASVGVPLLAIGLPLFDTLLAIIRRSARAFLGADRGLKVIVMPDVEHLHHRLLAAGASQRHVAALVYCLAAILVAVAVLLTVDDKATGAITLAILVIFAILGRQLANVELWYLGNAVTNAVASLSRRALAVSYIIVDVTIVVSAWYFAADMVLVPHVGFSGLHVGYAFSPFFIGIFAMFLVLRIYSRRWDRAQSLDYVALAAAVFTGWLVAYCYVSASGAPYVAFGRHAKAFLAIISAPLLFVRMIRPTLRSLLASAGSSRSDVAVKKRRVVVVGSGIGFYTFFYLVKNGAAGFDEFSIVAIADFKEKFIGNYSQGYRVHDARAELPSLLDAKGVSAVVVASVSGFEPGDIAFVRSLCGERGIEILNFACEIGAGAQDE